MEDKAQVAITAVSKPAKRYIAWLDITGFSELVNFEPFDMIARRMELALESMTEQSTGTLQILSSFRNKPPHYRLVGDTFVVISHDDSDDAFKAFLIATARLTRDLFAQFLPVRGAITFGEADMVAGTNYFLGRALIRAHDLERSQEWIGVMVDPDLPADMIMMFEDPQVQPLYLRWKVPRKKPYAEVETYVVNWPYRIIIPRGIDALFDNLRFDPSVLKTSEMIRAEAKILQSVAFAKHVVDEGLNFATPNLHSFIMPNITIKSAKEKSKDPEEKTD